MLPFTPYPALGTAEPCNLCDSHKSKTVSIWDRRLKRLHTVICKNCGLLRTDPMPTEEELNDYYSSLYRFDYQMGGKKPPRYHRIRNTRYAKERADYLQAAIKPGTKLLDFGSGGGEFLAEMKTRGCDVTGFEPGETYAAYAREEHGVNVITAFWRDVSFEEKSFDIITTHHVLEHLREPVDALIKMAAWLKDDGVLYVSVPNMLEGNSPAFERLHFAHVHGFVSETLKRAGRKAGLVPDDRFEIKRGTTIVFRKKRADEVLAPEKSVAEEVLAALPTTGPLAYTLGGGFLKPMIVRNAKTIADSLRRLPLKHSAD